MSGASNFTARVPSFTACLNGVSPPTWTHITPLRIGIDGRFLNIVYNCLPLLQARCEIIHLLHEEAAKRTGDAAVTARHRRCHGSDLWQILWLVRSNPQLCHHEYVTYNTDIQRHRQSHHCFLMFSFQIYWEGNILKRFRDCLACLWVKTACSAQMWWRVTWRPSSRTPATTGASIASPTPSAGKTNSSECLSTHLLLCDKQHNRVFMFVLSRVNMSHTSSEIQEKLALWDEESSARAAGCVWVRLVFSF